MASTYPTKRILFHFFCLISIVTIFFNTFDPTLEKNREQLLRLVQSKTVTQSMSIADRIKAESHESIMASTKKEKTDEYQSIIHTAATAYAVDPNLIKAIIMTESSGNPKAVSYAGAKGLMQLMPATAKELGVKDCFNPEHNINGGVKYFKKLLDRFGGDVQLALAAYNAGSRKVLQYKGVPPFKATKKYIKKVDQYYQRYKSQQAWGVSSV